MPNLKQPITVMIENALLVIKNNWPGQELAKSFILNFIEKGHRQKAKVACIKNRLNKD